MTIRKTSSTKSSAKKRTKVRAKPAPRQPAAVPLGKSPRTVAEARGLGRRDATISAKPAAESASGSLADTTGSLIDQQFRMWSAMMRMSPLPFVLQQQAVVAKLIMGFLMPTRRPPAAGEKK
jgi:hypothetical protein